MSLQYQSTVTITEPVSLADIHARIKLVSTTDDTVLSGIITQAREFAERVSKRSLAYKAYTLALDRFPAPYEPIRLPVPPLIAVSALTYLDYSLASKTWSSAEYFVAANQSPALILPLPGLVYPDTARVPGAVEISFTAGYGYAGAAASGSVAAIAAGPALPVSWKNNLVDLCVYIYENAAAQIPENLVQIPKIYGF